ncbi:heterokaryon incompatibility protein-domain-containing protein, partial [Clohesyomyces aquaticus]
HHHDECLDKDLRPMPTRVLDVGQKDSTIKLVEARERSGTFIALSHCWGGTQGFRTTAETIEHFKSGFDIEEAPATFQDAIIVTRLLGIPYLWIDSLCIIQDDPADWDEESSRMGSVYSFSYLTIAASRAASDSEGFLKPRQHVQHLLRINSPELQPADIYLRLKNTRNSYNELQSSGFREAEPLDLRAWTLQERWLSKRILDFRTGEVTWWCQKHGKKESAMEQSSENASLLDPTKLYSRGSYLGWYSLLEDYTRRSITFVSDIFPALSGLAAMVAQHDKTTYLAGLWWEDMALGLCWHVSSQSSSSRDPYTAPTWSWASVDG